MSTNESHPPKSAAARVNAGCGGYGCLKPGNNTDVFPTLDNLTMGCGASNCGIPPQRYLDQGMPDITYAPYMKMAKSGKAQDDVVMEPAPKTAPNYRFYEDTPFTPNGLTAGNQFTVKGYGNFKPRGWNMPDAYSGKYNAQGTGAAKAPSDFEAWQRGTSFPSRRYPLAHLPIKDALLAQEGAQDEGMSTGKKVGIAVGVIAGLGLLGGLVYYFVAQRQKKKPIQKLSF